MIDLLRETYQRVVARRPGFRLREYVFGGQPRE